MSQENDAVRDKDKKSEKVPTLWDDHEASAEIAAVLIRKHHQHLATAEIRYSCRNTAAKRAGKPVPGNIYKMAGKWKYNTDGKDFVMEIALEVWNDLEPNQRIALVDHLLTRCTGEESQENGEMKWGLRPPEIQEFSEVAERNGQWHEGLVEFEKSLRAK